MQVNTEKMSKLDKSCTERSNAQAKEETSIRTPRRIMLKSVRTPLFTVRKVRELNWSVRTPLLIVRKVRDLKVEILPKSSNAKLKKELGVRTLRGKVQKL